MYDYDYVIFVQLERAGFALDAMVVPVWIGAISLGVLAVVLVGFLVWSAWQAIGSRWGWLRNCLGNWRGRMRTLKPPPWLGNRGD